MFMERTVDHTALLETHNHITLVNSRSKPDVKIDVESCPMKLQFTREPPPQAQHKQVHQHKLPPELVTPFTF